MRTTRNSTILATAIALSLAGTSAFAQSANANGQAGARGATPAIPATPAVPATPAIPAVEGVSEMVKAVPATPTVRATPAVPPVKVDVDAEVKANASLDPTAVAREHQSEHAKDGQVVSAEAKAAAEVKQDAQAEARTARKAEVDAKQDAKVDARTARKAAKKKATKPL